jgi:hypothetical protein
MWTDAPLRHIWSRLSWLTDPSSAGELIERRAGDRLSDAARPGAIGGKAEGLSYAVRQAREYFSPPPDTNPTLAALSYYYGALWLLGGMVIADPASEWGRDDVAWATAQGHGIKALADPDAGFPSSVVMYLTGDGFLGRYLKQTGRDIKRMTYRKKPRIPADIPAAQRWTLRDTLARIPELRDVWDSTMEAPPEYIAIAQKRAKGSPEWIVQIRAGSSRHILGNRVAAHEILRGCSPDELAPGGDDATFTVPDQNGLSPIQNHTTNWTPTVCIRPLNHCLNHALDYHFCSLYALSIMVRYQAEAWRQLLEGKDTRMRSLVLEYLMVAERIVPGLALDYLFLQRHLIGTHSYVEVPPGLLDGGP